jgi:hypothetical protein
MSSTQMYGAVSRPTLGTSGGVSMVKIGTLAAIVAVFGLAIYLLVGRPAQNPAGMPAAVKDAAAADAASAPQVAGASQADKPAALTRPASAEAVAATPPSVPGVRQAAAPSSAPPPATATAEAVTPAATVAAAPADGEVGLPAPTLTDDTAFAPAPAAASKKAHASRRQTRLAATAMVKAGAAAPSPEQAAPRPDATSTLNPWWVAGGAQFRITAVSPARDGQALVVAFSEPVGEGAGAHLRLLNNDGSPAAGSWSAGANPRVLVRKDLAPGRYMLFVDSAVASVGGQALGAEMSGPAYVLASR